VLETYLRAAAASDDAGQKTIPVRFVDKRDQIYRQIDICVVPSRSEEPFPTTAIEAAFFGIPVVATKQGGLPEIVENGVTGLLVGAGQVAELSGAIQTLLADRILREGMGKRARARAAVEFTRERFIENFSHLLK